MPGAAGKKGETVIALVGNPNSGKTTLFNALTHSHQYVGNWAGVTVERKEGILRHPSLQGKVVDLPGVYSLSPFTPEEVITRRELLEGRPDLIINIVDATNLERNLYLTTQLLELDCPVILALNMMDELRASGKIVNTRGLSSSLGIPVVGISAGKGEGIVELIETIVRRAGQGKQGFGGQFYTQEVSDALGAIQIRMERKCREKAFPVPFIAVKLFEGDQLIEKVLRLTKNEKKAVASCIRHNPKLSRADRPMLIADQRYRWICDVVKGRVLTASGENPHRRSEALDKILTHRLLAIPIYLITMLAILLITFGSAGAALTEGCKTYIMAPVTAFAARGLDTLGVNDWCRSLIVDGVLTGVGGVLSFLPQIALLFFFLSILEGSGYMARVTFIMDKPLRKIGLSGKAFVPLMMGFGCSVPAILATRTLDSDKEKRLAILLTPFFSCSAKMPVYALFISAFFREKGVFVILCLYMFGVLSGVFTALLFKKTIIVGVSSAYVMELPPYRVPTPRNVGRQVWSRVKDFIVKVTTLMLLASVVIWILQSFTPSLQKIDPSVEIEQSILARLGLWMAPVFKPLGFGFWQASVSALSGFAAKETVVTTLQILYGSMGYQQAISTAFSTASALSYMVFILLYTPCVSAIAAARRELGSLSWTAFLVSYQCLLAWLVSFVVFQVGKLVL